MRHKQNLVLKLELSNSVIKKQKKSISTED